MRARKRKLNQKEGGELALQSIRPSKVARILREGSFYKSLDTDDDAAILVPQFATKASLIVRNNKDLTNLLSSLRFWGVGTIPDRILSMLLTARKFKITTAVVDKFKVCFPIICAVQEIHEMIEPDVLSRAVETKNMDVVLFLHRRGFKFTERSSYVAAKYGLIACLKLAYRDGVKFTNHTANVAASSGSLETIKYSQEMNCRCDCSSLAELTDTTQLNCLHYALTHHFPGADLVLLRVVLRDNPYALAVLLQHGYDGTEILKQAACWDAVRCMQYAHKHGAPWHASVVKLARDHDSHRCLHYALTHGCPQV